jgi:hypothetical protein
MLEVEIRRRQWERAETIAVQAAAIEPQGLSAELATFLRQQREGMGEEPATRQADVEAALRSSLADYRRMLAGHRRSASGDLLG